MEKKYLRFGPFPLEQSSETAKGEPRVGLRGSLGRGKGRVLREDAKKALVDKNHEMRKSRDGMGKLL